jgi:hypothetical protein
MSLRRAAFVEGKDQLTCGECKARLPDYVHAQIMEEDLTPRLAAVKIHLELCPHCSQHYKALLQIDEATLIGNLETPPVYPSPNLSFLKKKQGASLRERMAALGEVIIAQFVVSPVQPSLGMITREDTHGEERSRYPYRAVEAQVDILLNVDRIREKRGFWINGQLIPQERSLKSLEDITVRLFYKGAEVKVTKVSDRGSFLFQDVKKGIYEIEIDWEPHTIYIQDLLV